MPKMLRLEWGDKVNRFYCDDWPDVAEVLSGIMATKPITRIAWPDNDNESEG